MLVWLPSLPADPLAHVHFNVEGTIEFSALLYIPGMAPFEQQNYTARSKSIKLYVKRVFISDEFDEDLMPRYLSFVKGVVDSSDLPLNVSREILQESRIVRVIRKQLVRRSLEMMENLAVSEKKEDYKTFWESFGRNLKVRGNVPGGCAPGCDWVWGWMHGLGPAHRLGGCSVVKHRSPGMLACMHGQGYLHPCQLTGVKDA